MREPDQETAWLNQRMLSTNPKQLQAVDQLQFLNGLRRWSERFLKQQLSNGQAAELAMVNRNVLEAWRTAAGASAHRTMPLTRRMLLVFRLLEQLPTVTRYTHEEEQLLRENWSLKTHAQIAEMLDRSPEAIALKARQMGLPFQEPAREFSSEETQFITANYATLGAVEIGRRIGRSPQAIRNRASKLGVPGKIGRRKRQSPGVSD